MGLFDRLKKDKKEDLLKETVDVNLTSSVNGPFDESRLAPIIEEVVPPVVEEIKPAPVSSENAPQEDVEVLDPGMDLNKVGVCANCGQKIIPGSTTCFLCGKPVK